MKLPLKLKGFNLFFEGLNLYGLVADVTRPKVVFKTEDYRPGGLDVDLKIEQGIEPLELEFTVGGYAAEILREMGGSIAGKVLRYQGSVEAEDDSEYGELVGEASSRSASRLLVVAGADRIPAAAPTGRGLARVGVA